MDHKGPCFPLAVVLHPWSLRKTNSGGKAFSGEANEGLELAVFCPETGGTDQFPIRQVTQTSGRMFPTPAARPLMNRERDRATAGDEAQAQCQVQR
jgi:hypothetical protein